MIAYRLHFNEAHLGAVQASQDGMLGNLRSFHSLNLQTVEAGNTRLNKATGEGPLYDVGVYCINAARYLFQEEPTEGYCEHFYSDSDGRFDQVPEQSAAVLRFSSGKVATFTCGFGSSPVSNLTLVGTDASLTIDPAYPYVYPVSVIISKGQDLIKHTTYPRFDQFGPLLAYFSDCILQQREPEPSGEEGLIDLGIIEALEASARLKCFRPIAPEFRKVGKRPGLDQAYGFAPIEPPESVAVRSPSGE